ncbi:isopenicillin N synthase family dioxygenase [Streptomyces sp. NPDC002917]|uniref:isopenicillin N synthase family dioxygenase n=1 Tax=unclassified Streptomyces TaxID=2593676 RepID=UPI002E8110A9|nr:2OG-Fe(II) oxygenase family protein [Streptomyces sp. NBC_00562]WTC81851.1 isopenicillin N synthase family oxygenase [Streptomyces sp. NBC_01653]WTD33523.1 isopenicillin N synthase family oxygenase [Streptomyces sp. NBC_01643]WTD89014.1 isopenicillin N synthase family oxygenase [Streptomyces sp. NBC_01637]WUC20013.1 isopenicillin N synthase family oxygenase [Streptomyces sp. NBC_00562]
MSVLNVESATPEAAQVTVVDGYVPVIDLSSARSGGAAERQLAAVIDEVCRTSGFLVIVGHGVPERTIAEMYRATREFFALSAATKAELLAVPADPLMRGFGRQGSLAASNAEAEVEQERALPDISETFTVNRLGEPDADRALPADADPALRTPNRWPELPGFAEAYRSYYAAMEVLAADIMRLFALALDLPEDWFEDKIEQHMTNLTANFYPQQPEPPAPGQLRKGMHSDWGSLTILYQDDGPGGLQVLDKAGQWLDVPVIEGSFVVNIGDLMAIWTNNRWVSTVHRVVNPPRELAGKERYSVPFFHQPAYDALIECIPTCTGPLNPPRHQPVRSGDYIIGKFSRAYGA